MANARSRRACPRSSPRSSSLAIAEPVQHGPQQLTVVVELRVQSHQGPQVFSVRVRLEPRPVSFELDSPRLTRFIRFLQITPVGPETIADLLQAQQDFLILAGRSKQSGVAIGNEEQLQEQRLPPGAVQERARRSTPLQYGG